MGKGGKEREGVGGRVEEGREIRGGGRQRRGREGGQLSKTISRQGLSVGAETFIRRRMEGGLPCAPFYNDPISASSQVNPSGAEETTPFPSQRQGQCGWGCYAPWRPKKKQ